MVAMRYPASDFPAQGAATRRAWLLGAGLTGAAMVGGCGSGPYQTAPGLALDEPVDTPPRQSVAPFSAAETGLPPVELATLRDAA